MKKVAKTKHIDPVIAACALACRTNGIMLVRPKQGRKKSKIVAVITAR